MPLPPTPSHGSERKSLAEMFSEFLREVAALIAVFAILDKLVQEHGVTTGWLAGAWSIAAVALAAGMLIERLRR
jgi:hypothetical protein